LGAKLAHVFAAEEISRPVETSMGFEAQGRLQVGPARSKCLKQEFQGNFWMVLMGLPGDDD